MASWLLAALCPVTVPGPGVHGVAASGTVLTLAEAVLIGAVPVLPSARGAVRLRVADLATADREADNPALVAAREALCPPRPSFMAPPSGAPLSVDAKWAFEWLDTMQCVLMPALHALMQAASKMPQDALATAVRSGARLGFDTDAVVQDTATATLRVTTAVLVDTVAMPCVPFPCATMGEVHGAPPMPSSTTTTRVAMGIAMAHTFLQAAGTAWPTMPMAAVLERIVECVPRPVARGEQVPIAAVLRLAHEFTPTRGFCEAAQMELLARCVPIALTYFRIFALPDSVMELLWESGEGREDGTASFPPVGGSAWTEGPPPEVLVSAARRVGDEVTRCMTTHVRSSMPEVWLDALPTLLFPCLVRPMAAASDCGPALVEAWVAVSRFVAFVVCWSHTRPSRAAAFCAPHAQDWMEAVGKVLWHHAKQGLDAVAAGGPTSSTIIQVLCWSAAWTRLWAWPRVGLLDALRASQQRVLPALVPRCAMTWLGPLAQLPFRCFAVLAYAQCIVGVRTVVPSNGTFRWMALAASRSRGTAATLTALLTTGPPHVKDVFNWLTGPHHIHLKHLFCTRIRALLKSRRQFVPVNFTALDAPTGSAFIPQGELPLRVLPHGGTSGRQLPP